jgi:hypothetical protein
MLAGMTFDELLERIATEPNRTSEREVRVPSAELMKKLHAAGGMRLDALMADPRHTTERRTFRTGHLVGPPLSSAELEQWRAAWPQYRLPDDLVALLRRANGIHLWADLDEGRAYEGLAPLGEWRVARKKMWGDDADPALLPDRYLALSYHADGAAFVVLDTESGRYFLMDASGADESSPIGRSVGELLDWLWDHRIPIEAEVPRAVR